MKFSKPGKSRGDAIANLVEANKRRLSITGIVWDMKDEWTRNHVSGKTNRRKFPPPDIQTKTLPRIKNRRQVRALLLSELRSSMPYRLVSVLQTAFSDYGFRVTTLGDLANCSRDDLIAKGKKDTRGFSYRFGPKNLMMVRKLLGFYGLSLRADSTIPPSS